MKRTAGSSIYMRNVIFGIEDSLAATVGLLAGLAAEAVPLSTIILTGFVYIFVEAFSMGVGSFLSEESADDYEGTKKEGRRTLYASIAMFFACIVGGFVPLLPYFVAEGVTAIYASIALSVFFLGCLGYVQAKMSGKSVLPRIARMVLLGGTAIAVGVIVGQVVGAA